MTERRRFHLIGVAYVRRRLARRGIETGSRESQHGLDLTTDLGRTIAVRVARPIEIVRRVAGQEYVYPGAQWALHQHGERRTEADVWVLLLRTTGGRWRTWIVPGELMAGRLTVQMFLGRRTTDRGRPRSAPVRDYEGRWSVVGQRRWRRAA